MQHALTTEIAGQESTRTCDTAGDVGHAIHDFMPFDRKSLTGPSDRVRMVLFRSAPGLGGCAMNGTNLAVGP